MHLTELRTALGQTYDAAGKARHTYTGGIEPATTIRAVHIQELRRAVVALE